MRRIVMALVIATVLGGAVYGAAAGLGGLTGGTSLGAEDATVTGCDTDGISVHYLTGIDPATGNTVVFGVNLGDGIGVPHSIAAACGGQELNLRLTQLVGAIQTVIASSTLTLPAAPVDPTFVAFPAPWPRAHDVDDFHLVIQS